MGSTWRDDHVSSHAKAKAWSGQRLGWKLAGQPNIDRASSPATLSNFPSSRAAGADEASSSNHAVPGCRVQSWCQPLFDAPGQVTHRSISYILFPFPVQLLSLHCSRSALETIETLPLGDRILGFPDIQTSPLPTAGLASPRQERHESCHSLPRWSSLPVRHIFRPSRDLYRQEKTCRRQSRPAQKKAVQRWHGGDKHIRRLDMERWWSLLRQW